MPTANSHSASIFSTIATENEEAPSRLEWTDACNSVDTPNQSFPGLAVDPNTLRNTARNAAVSTGPARKRTHDPANPRAAGRGRALRRRGRPGPAPILPTAKAAGEGTVWQTPLPQARTRRCAAVHAMVSLRQSLSAGQRLASLPLQLTRAACPRLFAPVAVRHLRANDVMRVGWPRPARAADAGPPVPRRNPRCGRLAATRPRLAGSGETAAPSPPESG